MAATTEPNSGIKYGWTFGEQYHLEMDENLKRIGRFGFHPTVLGEQNTPPVTPSAGHTYIVGSSPTGAWATHGGKVAYWNGTAWEFAAPRSGWLVVDTSTSPPKLRCYVSSAWRAGIDL